MIAYILGLLVVALGGWFFSSKKASNAEALNENNDSKAKILKFDEFIAKSMASLEAERIKREQLDAGLKEKETSNVSKDDLIDFLNSKKED